MEHKNRDMSVIRKRLKIFLCADAFVIVVLLCAVLFGEMNKYYKNFTSDDKFFSMNFIESFFLWKSANDDGGFGLLSEEARVLRAYRTGKTSNLNEREEKMYIIVKNFCRSVSGRTDYEKVSSAYNYICQTVLYDDDAANNDISYVSDSKSAYGALIDHYTVCAGIAKATKLLLEASGIEAYYVTGFVGKSGHAWNIVKIDGKFYHIDPTWDNENDTHNWFLLSDEIIETSRVWDRVKYPECTDNQYAGCTIGRFSVENDAMIFIENKISAGERIFVKCKFDLEGMLIRIPETMNINIAYFDSYSDEERMFEYYVYVR